MEGCRGWPDTVHTKGVPHGVVRRFHSTHRLSDLSDLTALGGDTLDVLQRRVLPAYLMRHRWYGAKDAGAPAVTLLDKSALDTAEGQVLLTTLLVRPPGSAEQRYFLPLAIVREEEADAGDPAVLAKVRQGFLIDAFARNTFVTP